jgi:EAL domain-containing protein (putative c-di-GMP-specific phosphodiesterase class I)
MAPGRPLPPARAAYLYERASQGPWAEAFRARPKDGSYGRRLAGLGLKATAYAPIRNGAGLLGLILAGTFDESFASHLVDHMPIVGEFAATASALLAGHVEQGRRANVARTRITAIVAARLFHPVFQPVVELVSAHIVGYEALTRFDDGTPPDEVFADAQAVGLGLELEVACLVAIIKASEALLPHTWLSLNASPDLILESIRLRTLIGGQSRQVILEITEHAAIDDYAAVRAALTALGPTVSLAVDDAGAGFASLRHVVELSPRFLKLDIGLVRNVDGDPTRQAMIAGLTHFAMRSGSVVIAEGIEEPAELAILRELGVALGQGYLLGRPEPAPPASGNTRSRASTRRRSIRNRPGEPAATRTSPSIRALDSRRARDAT